MLTVFTLVLIYISPMLMWEKRLPFDMYVPFGIDETIVGFCFAYLYQLGTCIHVGGFNIAVNMYLFTMLIFIAYSLSLLSYRVKHLGYPKRTEAANANISFYGEMCGIIEFHLKIDR